MRVQGHSVIDQWLMSGQSNLTPEVALAILYDPAMLAAHDSKVVNLVKLLCFCPTPEHAAMLRREIRIRRIINEIPL